MGLCDAAPVMLEALETAVTTLGYDHDNKTDNGVYCYVCSTHGEHSATLPHKPTCLKRIMREAISLAHGKEVDGS